MVGTVVSNSTISHTCYNYMAGAALAVIGTDAVAMHNEVFDFPLFGISVMEAGGPSRASSPTVEIAYNYIHDFGGESVLSDFGGVYVSTDSDAQPSTNWLAADVHHNLITRASSYHYGANGLYSDHGTSGTNFYSNVVAGKGGRGISPHAGLNLTVTNNLFYNVSLQPFGGNPEASCVVSGPGGSPPGFSATLRSNIFAQAQGGSPVFFSTKDLFWDPPKTAVVSDGNVF